MSVGRLSVWMMIVSVSDDDGGWGLGVKLSPSPSELNLPADARARAARSWPARPGRSFPVAPSLITLLSIPTVPRKYTAAFSTHCVHNYQRMSTIKHTYILLYLSNYSVTCTLGQIFILLNDSFQVFPLLSNRVNISTVPILVWKVNQTLNPSFPPGTALCSAFYKTYKSKPQDIMFDVWYLFHICSNKHESIWINW